MKKIDIQFTCPDCDNVFTVLTQDILEREQLSCPNCGCELTEEELRHLKIALNYMQENQPN